ncbi:MAG: hypothetical protein JWR61_1020 [Ferruginibacter sp.]|nr:hypothetical protein [Ferruginibacter sp.]
MCGNFSCGNCVGWGIWLGTIRISLAKVDRKMKSTSPFVENMQNIVFSIKGSD